MNKTKGNKLQKLEKHRAWVKKHKEERRRNNEIAKGFGGAEFGGVKAKKSLGQNFLHDVSVVENICKSVEIDGKIVVEVGPGTGFLTHEILKHEPKKLILVEKDTHLFRGLQKTFNREVDAGKIDILNEDALKMNIGELAKTEGEKVNIIANLPYNIGTTLVMNWLEWLDGIENIVVMLQKEVVDRICATPNTKDYGRISVLAQTLCDCKKLFDVKPECFNPQPKVMSSVVKIVPKNVEISKETMKKLDKICRFAFNQRRKKLSNAFKKTEFESVLTDELKDKRAEELTVEEYRKLAIK